MAASSEGLGNAHVNARGYAGNLGAQPSWARDKVERRLRRPEQRPLIERGAALGRGCEGGDATNRRVDAANFKFVLTCRYPADLITVFEAVYEPGPSHAPPTGWRSANPANSRIRKTLNRS